MKSEKFEWCESLAVRFLEDAGLKFDRGFCWLIPDDRELLDDENSALDYLCSEWDYCTRLVKK